MRSKLLTVAFVVILCASAAHGLIEIRGGGNQALGELDGRYPGGLYASLGGEVGVPFLPVSVTGGLSYTTLGRDRPISDLLADYGEKNYPGVLPWADVINGLNLKSVFYGGSVGIRYYPVERFFFAPYVEGGGAYLIRELTANDIPVGLLGKYLLDIYTGIPSTNGLGVYADVGVRALPGLPLISVDAGARFTYGPGLGRTGFEEYLDEHVPAYEAPGSDNLYMVSLYLGASLF